MDERKNNLIKALEAEAHRFAVAGHNTSDHDLAIEYLKTGIRPIPETQESEMLDAVQFDYDLICSDYDC